MIRPRVVHLIDNLGYGGAERVALELVTSIDRERYAPLLCITRSITVPPARMERLREFRAAGGEVLQLDRSRALDATAWRPLLADLRTHPAHVIHGHMTGSSTWAVVLGRLLRFPAIVVHDHGSPPAPDRRLRVVQRALARGSHAIIAVSEADRQRWIQTTGVDPGRVRVIPNAVSVTPAPVPTDLRAELGLAPGTPLIGCVGLLRKEKAQIVLVEAAARLRDTHPDARVVLIGYGPEREALQSAIAQHGLGDRVLLLGLREDVSALLGGFDVTVCCSDREGIPLSVLEYMGTARPIVATRVGGLPELIDHEVHGLLVRPRDPGALADAIGRLLDDRALAAALGEQARERRAREFDPATVVRRLEGLYDELLAGVQLRS